MLDPSGNPRLCRCIQVVDGDLGGWLPKSIVSMITTQAFPISMRKANKLLLKIAEPRTISRLIAISEGSVTPETMETAVKRTALVVKSSENAAVSVARTTKTRFSAMSTILKLVKDAEPWLVLILFVYTVIKHRKN